MVRHPWFEYLPPLPNGGGWTTESIARHRVYWRWTRVRQMVKCRPVVFHWLEAMCVSAYAAGGVGRVRDRAEYEAFVEESARSVRVRG